MSNLHSKIILVKDINIDRNYVNVLSYSEQQMVSLCETNAIAQANDYQFIRANNSIYTNFTYAQCLQANYIAFQNPDYSNKWFFAFIDDVIYQGEENTEITFTVDSWSTWYGNWTKKPCYVIRQHATDDTIGANTLEENLDIGDVICEEEIEESSLTDYPWIAIASSWSPTDNTTSGGEQYSSISVYNGQIFANQLKLFRIQSINDYLDVGLFILRTNADGHIADIKDIFVVPDTVIKASKLVSHTTQIQGTSQTYTINYYTLAFDDEPTEIDFTIPKLTSFTDYTCKNNKCYCYPYNYLYVTNNIGNQNIYKYENFYNSANATFKLLMSISIGCSGKVYPTNYKKITDNIDESIPIAKFPTCEWTSDAFINWLTQNAVDVSTSVTENIVGLVDKTPVEIGTSVAFGIMNTIGTIYKGDLMPNIQGGQNTADINYVAKLNSIIFRKMRVKTENLKIIDDYFSRFGYKFVRILSPNLTGRLYWNYIEIGQHEEIGFRRCSYKIYGRNK